MPQDDELSEGERQQLMLAEFEAEMAEVVAEEALRTAVEEEDRRYVGPMWLIHHQISPEFDEVF